MRVIEPVRSADGHFVSGKVEHALEIVADEQGVDASTVSRACKRFLQRGGPEAAVVDAGYWTMQRFAQLRLSYFNDMLAEAERAERDDDAEPK